MATAAVYAPMFYSYQLIFKYALLCTPKCSATISMSIV